MKTSVLVIVSLLFAFACSNPSESELSPENDCKSNFNNIVVNPTSFYTGDTLTVTAEYFCSSTLVKFNNIEAVILHQTEKELFVLVPDSIGDHPSLTLESGSEKVTVGSDKLVLFPGSGIWKEMNPFPGIARARTETATVGKKAYLFGGFQYESNFEYFKTLFEYDSDTDTWDSLMTDESLPDYVQSIVMHNEKLIVVTIQTADVYDMSQKTVTATERFTNTVGSATAFELNNEVYVCFGEEYTDEITLKRFKASDNTWEKIHSHKTNYPPGTSIFMNFSFVHDGTAYIGYSPRLADSVELWSFNPEAGKLVKLSSCPAPEILAHMFTIDDLAYFIEYSALSVNEFYGTAYTPRPILYMYNLETHQWRSTPHNYPENFCGIFAFGVNNRGFAGLSISSSSPGFNFSNKVYEFIPH